MHVNLKAVHAVVCYGTKSVDHHGQNVCRHLQRAGYNSGCNHQYL